MNARNILDKNIKQFKMIFTNKNASANNVMRELLGKITMATELGALSLEDANNYIDIVFNMYDALEPWFFNGFKPFKFTENKKILKNVKLCIDFVKLW